VHRRKAHGPRFAQEDSVFFDDSAVLIGKFQGEAGDHRFVAVADDGVDFGEGGEFLGGALGVAAGNDDAGGRVLAANAAEVSAGLAVGFGGDAAGVYNYDISRGRGFSGRKTALAQVGGYSLAIGAAGAAAEVFNVIFCHVAQCINGGLKGSAGSRTRNVSEAIFIFLVYDPAM
jgi:hypothetical protein